MQVAVFDIFGVGFEALSIALLDTAPRGGVVPSHGESYHRAVLQFEGHLYEPLAEGATSDDQCTVEVLHRSGEDLTSTGAVLVDEDAQWDLLEASIPRTLEVFSGVVGALVVDEQVTLGEEFGGQSCSGL